MEINNPANKRKKYILPFLGKGLAAKAQMAKITLREKVVTMNFLWISRRCALTERETMTPSAAYRPVPTAVAAESAPSMRSQKPVAARLLFPEIQDKK